MCGNIHRNELILSGRDFVNIISNAISSGESQNFNLVEYIGFNIICVAGKSKIIVEFHLNEWRRLLMLMDSISYNKSIYKYIDRKKHYRIDTYMVWHYAYYLTFAPADEETFFEFIKYKCECAERDGLELQEKMNKVMSYVFITKFMHLKNEVRRYCLMRFGYEEK